MNKKGFTLVEILLVVVILGIISAITIPNIMESLSESKVEAGENVEKVLLENLKLYTKNNENEWWCDKDAGYGIECKDKKGNEIPSTGKVDVSLDDLKTVNPNIDMKDCVFLGGPDTLDSSGKYMSVSRSGSSGEYEYTYTVKIKCVEKKKEYYNTNKKDSY